MLKWLSFFTKHNETQYYEIIGNLALIEKMRKLNAVNLKDVEGSGRGIFLICVPGNYEMHLKFELPCAIYSYVLFSWSQQIAIDFSTLLPVSGDRGSTVARLRCFATNHKVAGSIPAGVIGILHWHKILPIALWPWGRLSL